MTEAAAAVRAARQEPIEHALGDQSFTFLPELPVDLVLAYDDLKVESSAELEAWTVAHLLVGELCDTSCADSGLERARGRVCPAEQYLRLAIRKARVDGRRPTRADLSDFHSRVLASYAVTEGESGSSADSLAAAGEPSSATVSGPASTSPPSSDQEGAGASVS